MPLFLGRGSWYRYLAQTSRRRAGIVAANAHREAAAGPRRQSCKYPSVALANRNSGGADASGRDVTRLHCPSVPGTTQDDRLRPWALHDAALRKCSRRPPRRVPAEDGPSAACRRPGCPDPGPGAVSGNLPLASAPDRSPQHGGSSNALSAIRGERWWPWPWTHGPRASTDPRLRDVFPSADMLSRPRRLSSRQEGYPLRQPPSRPGAEMIVWRRPGLQGCPSTARLEGRLGSHPRHETGDAMYLAGSGNTGATSTPGFK